ncbi:P-loop containing nucleoside triphosphate hydrolase protein [Lophiostoma macrostomum CBS 122681]|uniref:ATP-dependent RNA helicase n=1 Tax=Lophiostoma macrostomum CBS 122681 TaxID=1314788 RepID=A0A6A6TCW5_9PLEO|nr:P-loop containing nucleoside triphosphate hydrolase protein [Lophiostoma macrostomum CBS 122681]
MAGQLYARWAPPKPATASKPPNTAPSPRTAPGREQVPPQKPKTKKLGKGKSESKSVGQTRCDDYTAENDRERSQAPAAESRKNPKKRKRDTGVHERDETDETEEATPKKFRGVLSKFEKSSKRPEAAREDADSNQEQNTEPAEELHADLVPLPQPAPVPDAAFEPTFSTLPRWLAEPITVDSSKTVPFTELGVHDNFIKKLAKRGYEDALAVQSVLLPMLHPGYQQHLGDLCVSARTGSGKTLAYLLPIIEALKDQVVTTLSAIIVVPTRQLVDQALREAEDLCVGTKLKVGTALGNVPFTTEQKQLVKLRPHYDPTRAKELHQKASEQLLTGFTEGGIYDDLSSMPIDHIPQYESGVDVLICTPGRLVEHIESTTGFLLRSVRWLVIDEADQLLTQNFQSWATVLIDALHGETPAELMAAHERLRAKRKYSPWSNALPQRQIFKIVLSATMKKDLTKLGLLKFRRPKLVVVEEKDQGQRKITDGDIFELPSTLHEAAVAVGDGSNKPLYLLFLLLRHVFNTNPSESGKPSEEEVPTSPQHSDTDSDSSSIASETSPPPPSLASNPNRVLIFTKSNESASRLSHLLTRLEPSLTPYTSTMTPSSTAKQTAKLLRAFASGKTKLLIASDAASRGLDIPDISHVVNYDIPSSVTSYVHRVGRSARAGKEGQAVTLVTKTEARWFWHEIARGESVRRGNRKVARTELRERDVRWDRKRTYREALKELQGAVEGTGEQ